MGGLVIVETIIKYAPPALNLLGNLIKWLNEDTFAAAQASAKKKGVANAASGSRKTMRRGNLVTAAANNLTDDDGDMQALLDDLSGVVRGKFQGQYGYAYNGAASDPPSAQKDQNNNPIKLVPAEDFTTCASNSTDSISSYVDTNIITSNMPVWAQSQLRNELIGTLTTIINGQATNAWVNTAQPKTINGTGGTVLQADIILLYCVTTAPDPKNQSQNIKTMFCKYIGVYYLGTGWGLLRSSLPAASSNPATTLKVLEVDCTLASANAPLAKALGAEIVRTQPARSNTIVTHTHASHFSFAVAAKCATNDDDDDDAASTGPDPAPLPIEWFQDLLKNNKVKFTQRLRDATPDEYTEFRYLDAWDPEAAFKKGDFSSLKY